MISENGQQTFGIPNQHENKQTMAITVRNLRIVLWVGFFFSVLGIIWSAIVISSTMGNPYQNFCIVYVILGVFTVVLFLILYHCILVIFRINIMRKFHDIIHNYATDDIINNQLELDDLSETKTEVELEQI